MPERMVEQIIGLLHLSGTFYQGEAGNGFVVVGFHLAVNGAVLDKVVEHAARGGKAEALGFENVVDEKVFADIFVAVCASPFYGRL